MDELRALANRRKAAFWPPAAPFDNCDVVVCFKTPADAEAFSRSLAYGPDEEGRGFDWRAYAKLRKTSGGYD